jgi:hypothetical protein
MPPHKHIKELSKGLKRAVLPSGELAGSVLAHRHSTTDKKAEPISIQGTAKVRSLHDVPVLSFSKGALLD